MSKEINKIKNEHIPNTKESTQNVSCEKEKNLVNIYEQKIIELTMDLKRIQAEFENFQKRTEKQKEDYQKYLSAEILSDLLPVLDSLEIGMVHNKEFVKIYEQLFLIMKKKGIEKICVESGDKFDHESMDCLIQESNDKIKDGNIVQILSTGYKLNGKILRTTKVSVNKLNEKKKLSS